MLRKCTVQFVVMLVVSAAVARAGEGRETRWSGTASLFGGNSPVLNPVAGPTYGTTAQDLVGARYQLNVPVGRGHHWTASPGVSYGYGHYKNASTSGTSSSKIETTASMYEAMLDILYYNDCCDDDDFYCGPGLFYSSTRLKQMATGLKDSTSDPFNTFGVQMTVGGGIPIGTKFELTGGLTERLGMTSYDEKSTGFEDKLSAITFSTQLSGGLRVRF